MKIINMNIFDVTEGILCHSCNTQGAMGAGIAFEIKKRFPIVYKKYKYACDNKLFKLGMIQLIKISEMLYICNLAGQEYYGRNGKRYTDYDAMKMGLSKLYVFSNKVNLQVYMPYKIGCNLGGGDWNIVSKIIEEEILTAIVCKCK